jgi:tRNA pseudouridine13 synthase
MGCDDHNGHNGNDHHGDPHDRKKDPRVAALKQVLIDLPYVSGHLPGIGGTIKSNPEDFQVEEVLPYSPCGEGEHLYATIKRTGWNTADLGTALARCLDIKPRNVGWGGRKDKQAVCTQTFSLCIAPTVAVEDVKARLKALPIDILDLQRHRNKIKTGHVAANRFRILLSGVTPDRIDQAQAIAQELTRFGVPNYYGPQRFGIAMGNIERALKLIGRPKTARGPRGAFMVSVLQSALFNQWLSQRIQRRAFDTILKGDLAKKTDTGGMFIVEDIADAATRLARGAIVYTGPIFGHKMMAPRDEAAQWEARILADHHLTAADFKPLRAPGSRRPAVLRLSDLAIQKADDGLLFSFTLPSGAYATAVMREFTRESGGDAENSATF